MRTLLATVRNRDLTRSGRRLLARPCPAPNRLANLLRRHHEELRDGLGLSTPAIERWGWLARQAGALAVKVLGSGGGGLLLAYAPTAMADVLASLHRVGGRARPVRFVAGARIADDPVT